MREDFKKAGDLLGYANKLLEEYPNSYERMRIEDFTGQMYMEMGELDKAETHLRESLRLARERPDRRGQFACLKYLGEVYCKRGNAEAAKELLKEAEPLAAGTEEDQWIRGLAHAFHLRGLISNVEEKWDEALISFKTCIDYLTLWPDERLLTRARLNLALAKHHLGRTEDARTLLVENKDTFQKLGMHAKVTEMDRLLLQWK
jgi:tetratricopeptide (TPR) repeat protein